MKTLVYVFGILSAANVLACAAPTKTSAPPINADNFTTEGKPTKTVATPWGEKQVYDPTQDVEVIAAFDYVYSKNQSRNDNVDLNPYKLLFKNIRSIQLKDLSRLGCTNFEEPVCHPTVVSSTMHENCGDDLSFGHLEFNMCEEKATEFFGQSPVLDHPLQCVYGSSEKLRPTFRFDAIGRKMKREGLKNAHSQLSHYFASSCKAFQE